jgi:hypothetical protein
MGVVMYIRWRTRCLGPVIGNHKMMGFQETLKMADISFGIRK